MGLIGCELEAVAGAEAGYASPLLGSAEFPPNQLDKSTRMMNATPPVLIDAPARLWEPVTRNSEALKSNDQLGVGKYAMPPVGPRSHRFDVPAAPLDVERT